ncbi:hypothetical protein M430DRAFT_263777 [Amorphotheca resinae ATCC 22711]|uniref:Uncharacterized protein n=1 Tax=Amorphotheca resinae ATCC 22711 TaxID=857342 RepID=A0A2T3AWG7_AMORE|nr:hypothetical protein M430DRAFT_263777 [Amorphotheca resinae ATCC 22711]PSS13026.1 hypothetical protein M430DRAFT_263777 [Amorphotheca resinae ATCC 22711]
MTSDLHRNNHFNTANMAGGSAIMHLIEILGVFVCAHHFWPKGITYGEKEDWEKRYRHKHGHSSRSRGRRSDSSHTSKSNYQRRKEYKNLDTYDYDADTRPLYSRRASSRNYDYDEPAMYSRQVNTRY